LQAIEYLLLNASDIAIRALMSGTEALESLVSRHVISGAALGTTALVARAAGQPLKPLQGPAVNLKVKGQHQNPSVGGSGTLRTNSGGALTVVESAAVEALRGPQAGLSATVAFDQSTASRAIGINNAKDRSREDADGKMGLTIPADPVVYVGGARIIRADVLAGPSVVHVIDRVLLVPEASGILSIRPDALITEELLAEAQAKTSSSADTRRVTLGAACGLLIVTLGLIA
jgi:hypothetical protein